MFVQSNIFATFVYRKNEKEMKARIYKVTMSGGEVVYTLDRSIALHHWNKWDAHRDVEVPDTLRLSTNEWGVPTILSENGEAAALGAHCGKVVAYFDGDPVSYILCDKF